MYNGVANVYYANLDGFLARAEELKLNGLTEGSGPKNDQETRTETAKNHGLFRKNRLSRQLQTVQTVSD